MPDSLNRIEHHGERTTVTLQNRMDLMDYRSMNVLTREHPHLYTQVVNTDTVRVGTTRTPSREHPFEIHGNNTMYYETDIVERDLTDSEIEWCDETIMYNGDSQPDTVIEFEIPHPESLTDAIITTNSDAFTNLTAKNPDHETRHETVQELQRAIEQERLLKTKLDPQKGYPVDVDSEWDPDSTHNETRSQRHLHDMVGMRCDSLLQSFETVTGIEYYTFLYSRARSIDIHEPNLEYWDVLALDVIGNTDWSYCRKCGGVLPETEFLHVQRRGCDDGKSLRVCEPCAEDDYTNQFSADAVAQAKDARAQSEGGQRRIQGYSE